MQLWSVQILLSSAVSLSILHTALSFALTWSKRNCGCFQSPKPFLTLFSTCFSPRYHDLWKSTYEIWNWAVSYLIQDSDKLFLSEKLFLYFLQYFWNNDSLLSFSLVLSWKKKRQRNSFWAGCFFLIPLFLSFFFLLLKVFCKPVFETYTLK